MRNIVIKLIQTENNWIASTKGVRVKGSTAKQALQRLWDTVARLVQDGLLEL